MHILMTVNAAWNIWNFRRAVVRALIGKGHDVTVLAPLDDSVAELEALGCRTLPLAMNAKGLNPLEGLRLVSAFKRTFKTEKPDIVLSYTIKNNLFGAMAAKPLGIPFVPNVTGLGTAFLSGGALEKIAEILYRRAFAKLPIIFFQNEDDEALFVSRALVTSKQAHRLPGSGIDLQHYEAKAIPRKKTPAFLLIARLLRDKGVNEFVEAARQIKSERPDVKFQLLGAIGSENRSAIPASTVDAWVAEGVVDYLGTAKDVRPVIEAANCVVLPSYREGAPRTLIEAAAMARPLITTDVPGCRSVVDDGENGFLCHVRDSRNLADAIAKFLALSTEQQKEMGKAGRAKMAREFDEQIVVDAYMSAIDHLTGGSSKPDDRPA